MKTDELLKPEGDLVGHFNCFDCGGKDPLAIYKKPDGSHDGYCWSNCEGTEKFKTPEQISDNFDVSKLESYARKGPKVLEPEDKEFIEQLEFRGWPERKISKVTSEKFGVRSEYEGSGRDIEIKARYYPVHNQDDEIVGYKKRVIPKEFVGIGNTKVTNKLFGENVWEGGGKYLCITTGEEDAMALAQTLHNVKGDAEYWTAVVSVTSGDGSIIRQLKSSFEFINSFEKVILCFDQDDAAQKYVTEAARLLAPGKAHIAKLPLKDASEMVQKGRSFELKSAFFNAERFSPVDVCTLGQLWDDFESSVEDDIIPLPPEFGELAELMGGGPAAGEVTVIGALTSVGKSTMLNNLVYHIAQRTPKKTGLMYLESSPREIVRSFLSIHTEENLALQKYSEMDMKKLKVQFQDMIGRDEKIVTVNHNGSFTSVDEMFEKIRWLIKGMGCEVVVLDPLQAAVPNNENAVIDNFMDSLLKLAKETMASIIVVSHMKKPDDDRPHGVSEYSLKGSSSINQIAFNTILMSRDKVNENINIRNSTKLTLVKCRRTGLTGNAGWLAYDPSSAKITATGDPYEAADMEEMGLTVSLDGGYTEDQSKKQPDFDPSNEWDFQRPDE